MTQTDRSSRSCSARNSGSRYGAGAGGTIAQRSGRTTREGWHSAVVAPVGYNRGPGSRANQTEWSFQSWTIRAPPAAASANIERGPPSWRMSVAGPSARFTQATVATTLPVAPWWQRCPKIHTRWRSLSYSTSRLMLPARDCGGERFEDSPPFDRTIEHHFLALLSAFMLVRLSRRMLPLLVLAAVLAGACGSSPRKPSSTGHAAVPDSATGSSTPTSAATTRHKHRSHGRSASHQAEPSNVRLPATYVIRPGGALSPPLVSAPAAVAIALTVVSSDGRAHRVRLRSLNGPVLVVPAAGRASALFSALKAGTYPIYVDGARRGALVIGVTPGP
jgi:hypothetical protein